MNYYKTLGVDKTASEDEIKRSYRALAREYHPDRNNDPQAEERIKEINAAYTVLSNKNKKSKYDLELTKPSSLEIILAKDVSLNERETELALSAGLMIGSGMIYVGSSVGKYAAMIGAAADLAQLDLTGLIMSGMFYGACVTTQKVTTATTKLLALYFQDSVAGKVKKSR